MTCLKKLRYGNTNTFFIKGRCGGLLVDTDYAGTLQAFFHAIKKDEVSLNDITYVIATHYHPDHIGIVGELQKLGIKLVIVDVQKDHVHFADAIFGRENRLDYIPVNEEDAVVISCEESRSFLNDLGIDGEIIRTPSHSADSISLILDSGECIVGDLEPYQYLEAYDDNAPLKADWEQIRRFDPKRILYAHVNDKGAAVPLSVCRITPLT